MLLDRARSRSELRGPEFGPRNAAINSQGLWHENGSAERAENTAFTLQRLLCTLRVWLI